MGARTRRAIAAGLTLGALTAGLVAPGAGAGAAEPAPPTPVAQAAKGAQASIIDLDAPPAGSRPAGGPSDSQLDRASRSRRAGTEVVEVHHDGDRAAAEAAVVAAGGRVHGPAGDHAVEATVPAAEIAAIEGAAHVTHVGAPSFAAPTGGDPGLALGGQEVTLTNADDWHAAGILGAGIKVGIIDGFDGDKWDASVASGDIAGSPAGTFCRWAGSSCNIWGGQSEHGVAVAEIIHEMAPQAQLYIAQVGTTADFQAAIDYFGTKGVKIVTRSQTAEYDGPGNGTGGLADVIDSAVSKGMVYLNAAGNSAGTGPSQKGSYWRGAWADADADGWLDFAPGDELLQTRCWFFNGLRWSDWGGSRTDYDVYLFNASGSTQLGGSESDQTAGAPPIERLNTIPCNPLDTVQIGIHLYAAGSGTAGDVLETMVNGVGLEYWQNPHSAAAPMADSDNPGMLTVGAIDPAAGTTIAGYSAQGPTNDGRTKPDISGVSCVASTAYAPDCFNGTSAATPVVAGAVVLALSAGVASTPAGLATWLEDRAQDRGAAGPDNVFGRGQMYLPAGNPAPFATLRALVDRQHLDLLGRVPTATERTTWSKRLLLGTHTRADLVASLRASSDNVTNVDPVTRLYRAYFLRIPDRSGLLHWIGRRRAGTSLNQISQSFVASQEFKTRYGTLTNRQFVELIYTNILGRPGEPSGVTFWTGELDARRRTRGQVMVGFSESAEYKAKQVKAVNVSVIVIAMLRRAPTTQEMSTLTAGPATSAVLAEWAFTRPEYSTT